MNNEKGKITIGKPYIKKELDGIRLCASINWNDKEETVWYSVDAEYEEYLTYDRADAFVVGLLMTAMREDMDIICESPLTRRLRYQLNHYLIPMLAANLKELHLVEICAEVTDDVLPCAGAVGMCWAEDVNSMYTLKKHLHAKEQDYRLTHLLITNSGVLDETDTEAFRKQVENIKRNFAEELELKVVSVDCNLSEQGAESFYCVPTFRQASVALALQKLFGVFLKPATYEFSSFSFDEYDCSHYDLATLGCLETDTTAFYSAGGGYSQGYKLKEVCS